MESHQLSQWVTVIFPLCCRTKEDQKARNPKRRALTRFPFPQSFFLLLFSLNYFSLYENKIFPQMAPSISRGHELPHTECQGNWQTHVGGQCQECLQLKRLRGEAQGAWESLRQTAHRGKLRSGGPRAHKCHSEVHRFMLHVYVVNTPELVFFLEKYQWKEREESRVHFGFHPKG